MARKALLWVELERCSIESATHTKSKPTFCESTIGQCLWQQPDDADDYSTLEVVAGPAGPWAQFVVVVCGCLADRFSQALFKFGDGSTVRLLCWSFNVLSEGVILLRNSTETRICLIYSSLKDHHEIRLYTCIEHAPYWLPQHQCSLNQATRPGPPRSTNLPMRSLSCASLWGFGRRGIDLNYLEV